MTAGLVPSSREQTALNEPRARSTMLCNAMQCDRILNMPGDDVVPVARGLTLCWRLCCFWHASGRIRL